jgi:hypothetical protein
MEIVNMSVASKTNSLVPQYGPGCPNGQDAGHFCPKSCCHLLADPKVLQQYPAETRCYTRNVCLTLAPSGHKTEQYHAS